MRTEGASVYIFPSKVTVSSTLASLKKMIFKISLTLYLDCPQGTPKSTKYTFLVVVLN